MVDADFSEANINPLLHSAEHDESVIDLEVLAQMVGNEPESLHKFAHMFLETAKRGLEEMQEAYLHEDTLTISALGHKLKSSARSVGAHGFAEICDALEDAGKQGNLSDIYLLLQSLAPLLDRIEQQIQKLTV
jgi:HPt (histidine-containing phosphotransfer) domain-containing protein